jgi:hypothetical protein
MHSVAEVTDEGSMHSDHVSCFTHTSPLQQGELLEHSVACRHMQLASGSAGLGRRKAPLTALNVSIAIREIAITAWLVMLQSKESDWGSLHEQSWRSKQGHG